jgi:hypothetical protein
MYVDKVTDQKLGFMLVDNIFPVQEEIFVEGKNKLHFKTMIAS